MTTFLTPRQLLIASVCIELFILSLFVVGIAIGHALEPSNATPP